MKIILKTPLSFWNEIESNILEGTKSEEQNNKNKYINTRNNTKLQKEFSFLCQYWVFRYCYSKKKGISSCSSSFRFVPDNLDPSTQYIPMSIGTHHMSPTRQPPLYVPNSTDLYKFSMEITNNTWNRAVHIYRKHRSTKSGYLLTWFFCKWNKTYKYIKLYTNYIKLCMHSY